MAAVCGQTVVAAGVAGLGDVPRGERVHIAIFGLRNAGKSTLANALTGQPLALVSEVPGTTTDPVSKAMEILPLGPCLLTDTAGLDDEGELGARRVRRSLEVLATVDVAVWVVSPQAGVRENEFHARFLAECARRSVAVVEYRRGESVEALRDRLAKLAPAERQSGLLDGVVWPGANVLCVCPIDASAPKGRLILPQVETLRACLDAGATVCVCQPRDLGRLLAAGGRYDLAVTDSQAFGAVAAVLPPEQPLTSFSILFARQKGDLSAYRDGLERLASLRDGDVVLVAEGCTHRRQCGDIGTVKIPAALRRLTGRELEFRFASGGGFDLSGRRPSLVVQCGGCMLTRREVLRRLALARAAGVPVVNYGMLLAKAAGVDVARCLAAVGWRRAEPCV